MTALLLSSGSAHATDGFELQPVQTTLAGDRFFVAPDGNVAGDEVWYAKAYASEAYRPLLREDTPTGTHTLVSSQLYVDLGGAYAIGKRGLVGADLPFVPFQGGNDPASPPHAGLGDARIAGRVRLYSLPHLDVGAELRVWLPTGSASALTGDGAFRASAHVAASGRYANIVYAASLGFLARERRVIVDAQVGPAIPFALAAGIELLDDRLQIGPELTGFTVLGGGASFFGASTTPIDALLGARYREGDLVFGAALGPGVTTALGVSPRVALSVAWEPPESEPPPPVLPESPPANPHQQNPSPPPIPATAPSAPPPASASAPASPVPPPPPRFPSASGSPVPPPPPPPPSLTKPPPAAPVDPAVVREQARDLFKRGVTAYDAGRYADAADLFGRAYALKPHPTVLQNLAQSEYMAGKFEAACAHFKSWQHDETHPTAAEAARVAEELEKACR